MEFPPPLPAANQLDLSTVKPATKQALAEILAEKLKRPRFADDENHPDTTFMRLGLDSLDAMEVSRQVEQRFGFTGSIVPLTIGDLWALAAGLTVNDPPKLPAPVGCAA